jgi:phospholipase A1/A2
MRSSDSSGGAFGLTIRPWYRIREDWTDDNNPDITNFVGRGDIVATYQKGGHNFSLLLRTNMDFWNFHGALQVDWSVPLYRQLKGYVQVFTGYGESLIDYNHQQTTLGSRILVDRLDIEGKWRSTSPPLSFLTVPVTGEWC